MSDALDQSAAVGAAPPPLRLRSLGNAGVELRLGERRVYIDAYFAHNPGVGSAPLLVPGASPPPDLLLITHGHPDHCLPSAVRLAWLAAARAGRPLPAAGPARALRRLARQLAGTECGDAELVELEPREGLSPPDSFRRDFAGLAAVTAHRTRHAGAGHNSYMIEFGGARVFHDGDNEHTQNFDLAALGPVDALCLCPWQGSGAADLVRRWRPGLWVLVHLTGDELDAHARGGFLPALAGAGVWPEALGLRPGREVIVTPGGQ